MALGAFGVLAPTMPGTSDAQGRALAAVVVNERVRAERRAGGTLRERRYKEA